MFAFLLLFLLYLLPAAFLPATLHHLLLPAHHYSTAHALLAPRSFCRSFVSSAATFLLILPPALRTHCLPPCPARPGLFAATTVLRSSSLRFVVHRTHYCIACLYDSHTCNTPFCAFFCAPATHSYPRSAWFCWTFLLLPATIPYYTTCLPPTVTHSAAFPPPRYTCTCMVLQFYFHGDFTWVALLDYRLSDRSHLFLLHHTTAHLYLLYQIFLPCA